MKENAHRRGWAGRIVSGDPARRRRAHGASPVLAAVLAALLAGLGSAAEGSPDPAAARTVDASFPGGFVRWEGDRPHRILPAAETRAAEKSLAGLEDASLAVVMEAPGVFGVDPGDLVLQTARRGAGIHFLIYRQMYRGLPIEGARVDFRWRDGRLVMTGADTRAISDLDPDPDVTEEEAVGRAAVAVGLTLEGARPDEARLTVVPEGHFGQTGHRLAWRILIGRRDESAPGFWAVWIDAADGAVLQVRDLIAYGAGGRVEAWAERFTPGDRPEIFPAAHSRVLLLSGGQLLEQAFAGADGVFRFTPRPEEDLRHQFFLDGRFCRVFNASGLTPSITVPAGDGDDDLLTWDEHTAETSERDAYVHTNVAHDAAKSWDPDWAYFDRPMRTEVDAAGVCNAFFDAGLERIVYYRSGGGCVATSRIADVVYHEYAHAITYSLFLPEFCPADMHEGYSDYYGATLTDQPDIGVGFRGPGTRLRTVDNDLVYPDDLVGEVHGDGLILAGALWNLREAVGAEVADRLYHFHRYGHPMSFDDAFFEILVTDDDDGDVFNGTPHFQQIVQAFLPHGIGRTEVGIHHVPLPDTETAAEDFLVEASVLSLFQLAPDSVVLHYRMERESPFNALPMSPEGSARTFVATIPGQPAGTRVEYYFFAADTEGNRSRLPAGAPDALFSFYVGRDDIPPEIAFSPLTHGTADQDSFLIEARVTDNTGRMGDVEIVYRRPSDGADLRTPLAPAADDLYRGFIRPGALEVVQTIFYRIFGTDLSQQSNTGAWPGGDAWASFEIRDGWFRDLEGGDGGFDPSPGGNWEWGVPYEDKGPARSGRRVWATNLDGRYSDLTTSYLTLPDLDLGSWDRGTLEFWHVIRAENSFDGGQVQISRNGGLTYRAVEPRKGYSHTHLDVFNGPAFSAANGGWENVEVPLDGFLGSVVSVRFAFASDENVNAEGWMLDDVRFVRRQTLAEPASLVAETGRPEGVPLAWSRPRSTSENASGFFGYNVYRGETSGVYGPEPLNGQPIRARAYLDGDVEPSRVYYYVVTAVYDEGESSPSEEAAAAAFRALLALDVDTIRVEMPTPGVMDSTFAVRNVGVGVLTFSTFLADPGKELADIRLIYGIGDGTLAGPAILHRDGEDQGSTLDISDLAAGDDGRVVALTLREHGTHGDPRQDFTVILALDTDLDQDTGLATTNLGADYIVVLGAFPQAVANVPGLILSGSNLDDVRAFPDFVEAAQGGDSIRVGFPLSVVDDTRRFAVEAVVVEGADVLNGDLIDSQPDPLEAVWLSRDLRRGEARPDMPAYVSLTLDGRGLAEGRYGARLLLATSDAMRPAAAVDVFLTVGNPPPEPSLASFEATSRVEGMDLAWRPGDGIEIAGFRLYRRDAEGTDEVHLTAEAPLAPLEDGAYRYLDRGVTPGRTYAYRLEGMAGDGAAVDFGTVTRAFAPQAPAVLTMLSPRPVPFRDGVTLRYGLPRPGGLDLAVYSVSGRRIATLERGEFEPGVYEAAWDGRDEAGRPAASGVYFALLRWERLKAVQRLVLTR